MPRIFTTSNDPFRWAAPWARSLRDMLAQILANQTQTQEKIMALIDDVTALNTAVADLQTEVGTIGTDMDSQLAALNAALAASGANSNPAVQAATANIRTLIDTLQATATRDMPVVTPPVVPPVTPPTP